jgi:hypothetical protein
MPKASAAGIYPLESLGPETQAFYTGREYLSSASGFLSAFNLQDCAARIQQVHGDAVFQISGPGDLKNIPEADALITNLKNIALIILTADCIPAFIYDPVKQAAGLVHAGWRGLKQNILPKTILRMQAAYESKAGDLKIAFGPCIRECCYEVGPEFKDYFPGFFKPAGAKGHLDLIAAAKDQARRLGVPDSNISDAGLCTSCDRRFFSYRRDKTAERMISVLQIQS